MAGSRAYAGIRADVLAIVEALPRGRVTTFAAIGEHMHVMPRHVAYVLARLTPLERETLPWHRVVGAGGKLGRSRHDNRGCSQAALLTDEGFCIVDDAVVDFPIRFVPVHALAAGVPRGRRYEDGEA